MAAVTPVFSVISTAHVAGREQSGGRMSGRMDAAHGASLRYANRQPPLWCVAETGIRASDGVSA